MALGTVTNTIGGKKRPTGLQMGGNGQLDIASVLDDFNTSRDAANAANTSRYNQGLNVLQKNSKVVTNLFGQALGEADKTGAPLYAQAAQDFKNATGSTQNSAINRGIGNFTITDALQQGNKQTYDKANLGIADAQARQKQGILQNQAQTTMGLGGRTADFIAARNDIGPDLGQYAGIISAAAAGDGAGEKKTATIIDPSFFGKSPVTGGGAASATASGASGGSGSYFGGSASPNPTTGGGGGGGGGLGGGGTYYSAGGISGAAAGGTSPIGAAALVPGGGGAGVPQPAAAGGSGGPSQVMANAGYAPGSISVTPSGQEGYAAALAALRKSQNGMVYDNQYARLRQQFGIGG